MAHEPTVVGEAPVRVLGSVRSEEPLDDHRENWDVGGTDGAIDRDIDCGVLQRAQPSLEHGLGKRADEVAAAGCDLAGPLRIVETGGAMAVWSPSGDSIAFSADRNTDYKYEVYVRSMPNGTRSQVTNDDGKNYVADWGPSGR